MLQFYKTAMLPLQMNLKGHQIISHTWGKWNIIWATSQEKGFGDSENNDDQTKLTKTLSDRDFAIQRFICSVPALAPAQRYRTSLQL